jgi:G3E family GTPase
VLVLPLPINALWSWSLKSRGHRQPFEAEIVAGFLGAGKTTFLRRTLADVDPAERTVALINDFSELGVDGSLIKGRGAEVVELSNGCICCSLRQDLAQQLREVVANYAPQRILIEPSGVADVAQLMGALDDSELKPLVARLRLYTVIDAGAFLRDYAAMPDHFEAQARMAPVFIVNKTDLVDAADLQTITDTLRALNPTAVILPTSYGAVQAETLDEAAQVAREHASPAEPDARPAADHSAHHHHAGADDDPQAAALGLHTWSAPLNGECDPQSLRDVLDAVAHGAFGDVARVKGIVRSGAGWVHFDVAGGRSRVAAFAPRGDDEPRVVAIGRKVDGVRLKAALDACRAPVMGNC